MLVYVGFVVGIVALGLASLRVL